MASSENVPGKRKAIVGLVLAGIALFYLLFVPVYATSLLALVLGIAGLVQERRAKKDGYKGHLCTIAAAIGGFDVVVSILLLLVPVLAILFGQPE